MSRKGVFPVYLQGGIIMYQRMTIIGRLTKDVEARQVTINGEQQTVANFPVAVDDRGTTEYFDVVAWRKLGENCKKFINKGRMVAVDGKMKRRSYDAQDGRKVYVWELIADDVRFLDSAKQGQQENQQPQSQSYNPTAAPTGYQPNQHDDNLPF